MWTLQDSIPVVNLARYYLLVTPFFEIYLHQFLADDEPVFHNHPWSFLSLLLSGGYIEESPTRPPLYRQARSLLKRQADYLHRVKLEDEKKGITFSLIITGKRNPSWSFYDVEGENFLTPQQYGEQRGASIMLFKDLRFQGIVFPRIQGGTALPTLWRI
jgi:hypothetical protein